MSACTGHGRQLEPDPRTRPRCHPGTRQARPPAHLGRQPYPDHRPRRPARPRPRLRASGEGSHLRPTRAQGHLPARTRQTPGLRHDQPGVIYAAIGPIWGNEFYPRTDTTHCPTSARAPQRRIEYIGRRCPWLIISLLSCGNFRIRADWYGSGPCRFSWITYAADCVKCVIG